MISYNCVLYNVHTNVCTLYIHLYWVSSKKRPACPKKHLALKRLDFLLFDILKTDILLLSF